VTTVKKILLQIGQNERKRKKKEKRKKEKKIHITCSVVGGIKNPEMA
jgi:hypothetical protein